MSKPDDSIKPTGPLVTRLAVWNSRQAVRQPVRRLAPSVGWLSDPRVGCCIFSIMVFAGSSLSQTRVVGSVGANYPIGTDGYQSVYEQWRPGILAGVRVDVPLASEVRVEPMVTYQHLLFSEYQGFADYEIIAQEADPSQVIQLGADLQFLLSGNSTVTPYLFFGGGYQWITFGTVSTTERDLAGNIIKTEWERTPKSAWFIEYGLGLRVPVLESFAIQTTIKSANSFHGYVVSGDVVSSDNGAVTDWLISIGGDYIFR